MTEASKAAEEKSIPQLCLEIRNLAHYAWNDPENAEYLFTEIEHRADEIERHYRAGQTPGETEQIQQILYATNDYPKTVRDSIRPTIDALRKLRDLAGDATPAESTPPTPFGWWDTFNEHLWRTETDAAKAIEGGNHVIALYAGAAQKPGATCPACGSTHKPCRIGNGIWNCTDPWHSRPCIFDPAAEGICNKSGHPHHEPAPAVTSEVPGHPNGCACILCVPPKGCTFQIESRQESERGK